MENGLESKVKKMGCRIGTINPLELFLFYKKIINFKRNYNLKKLD